MMVASIKTSGYIKCYRIWRMRAIQRPAEPIVTLTLSPFVDVAMEFMARDRQEKPLDDILLEYVV